MRTHRTLMSTAGVVLATASLILAGGVASSASHAGRHAAPRAATPNPAAPHVGTVASLQTGRHISVNNPRSVHAFLVLHRQMRHAIPPTLNDVSTIHEYVGTSFKNLAHSRGSQATQSVSPRIEPANPGTTLYTPTMYPSGGSCIEVSTAYFFDSQVVAAWDWCVAIRFVAQVDIDRSFMNTYTRDKNYTTQIVQTNKATNKWTAYLYNYATGTWETLFTQSGSSQVGLAQGWDLYELYSEVKPNGQTYACADLKGKRVESQDIQVRIGSTWQVADATNAGDDYDVPLSEFRCESLHYSMITPFSHWKAIG
jgi:hypothetical protein